MNETQPETCHEANWIRPGFLLAITVLAGTAALYGQQQPGPIKPPPPSSTPLPLPATKAEPPPIPVDEIIHRFAQKEEELLRAREGYTYQKTVRVEEIGEDGKPAGAFRVVTEPAVGPDGKRYERVVEQQPSTLHYLRLEPEDLELLASIPAFPLTTQQLNKYEISYEGKQQVDELTTYVFRVTPRQIERTRAYFSGVLWVDDRDLVVVKTYGKWVTETGDVSAPELPFTMWETYRQPVGANDWFPAYSRSDDTLGLKNGNVPIRLTIIWKDYKPLPGASPKGTATRPSHPGSPSPQ